ncbi:acyl-CoA thioesterase [Parvularcula lutaonensis]|uniref:Acyl-CoA thioesterase n=1 Tax=Parvularcula lutaonensis TaxID=491923 RepID=A0ABV7MAQ5_9PROT|nr:thioesterase family protein [Parvularcula lutaonensis]GGY38256.1 thioesterase [Parvularcula lutaonensis]
MAERKEPSTRSDYRAFRTLTTRWADNDVYGHMNNVVHYALFDTAVNQLLIEEAALDIRSGPQVGLVVETRCSYFSEMAFPDKVHAGIRTDHVGNSAVTYGIGLFRNDDFSAAAEGQFTHVYVDAISRRPKPLAPKLRALVEGLAA